MPMRIWGLLIAAVLLAMLPQPEAFSQQADVRIKRTPLQAFDIPGTGYQTLIVLVDIAPDIDAGRHTHPGIEATYMIEGELVLLIEGQPDRLLKAGDSFQVPPGLPHDVKLGRSGARFISTYVVEKGKPLTTPAP